MLAVVRSGTTGERGLLGGAHDFEERQDGVCVVGGIVEMGIEDDLSGGEIWEGGFVDRRSCWEKR